MNLGITMLGSTVSSFFFLNALALGVDYTLLGWVKYQGVQGTEWDMKNLFH